MSIFPSSDGRPVRVQFAFTADVSFGTSPPPLPGPLFPFATERIMGEPAYPLRVFQPLPETPPPGPLPGQQSLFGAEVSGQRSEVSQLLPTLREGWLHWWLPEKQLSRAPATIGDDRTSLDRWESACAALFARQSSAAKVPDAELKYRTMYPVLQRADPRLDEISKDLLVQVVGVWAAEQLSADTYRKRLSTVKKVLQEAVDRDLLPKVPKFPDVPSAGKLRGFAGGVELEEVDLLYRHAEAAEWPRFRGAARKRWWWLTPAAWWRSWLVLWWCYGLRSQDVCGVKAGSQGLLWDAVRPAARCPVPGIKVEHAGGWLFAVPQKTERAKGQPVIAPLLPVVARHLALFRDVDPQRVFPNGRSHKLFYAAFRQIVQAAGVPDDVTISASKTRAGQTVRSIRKGCSNNWDEASGGLLGEWILGHANLGVNASHYKSIARPMVDAAAALELPASFADESLLPKSQKRLISNVEIQMTKE